MAGFLVGIGKAGEVAERSPAVISANLKEDMLLQKKRVVLDRSMRNIVHQIRVDQKVVYKNFQSRLVRSKLAFARLMGQKDVEKDLRAKNLGGLNTDIVGSPDEEYTFLEKLEQRPCTASSISPRIALPRKSKMKPDETSLSIKSQEVKPEHLLSEQTERPSSATARVNNSLVTSNKETGVRPATTTGIRVNSEFIHHQMILAKDKNKIPQSNVYVNKKDFTAGEISEKEYEKIISEQANSTGEGIDKTDAADSQLNEDNDISNGTGEHNDRDDESTVENDTGNAEKDTKPSVAFLDDLEIDLDKLRRPRTVAITGQGDMSTDESPPISPSQFSRRASRASDFFQEEKKIDLIQLRLNAARAVDFTDQVKRFCENLDSAKEKNKPTTDYYNTRLEASIKERLASEIVNVPGTPDDENRRAIGNIHVRSLTLPDIDWNFE